MEVKLDGSVGREVALLDDGLKLKLVVFRNDVLGKPDILDEVLVFGQDGEVSAVSLDAVIFDVDALVKGANPGAEEIPGDVGDFEAANVVVLAGVNAGDAWDQGHEVFIGVHLGRHVGLVVELMAVGCTEGADVGQDFESLLDLAGERDVVADLGCSTASNFEEFI